MSNIYLNGMIRFEATLVIIIATLWVYNPEGV